jgi:uncharacterized protein (TIGR02117 family)
LGRPSRETRAGRGRLPDWRACRQAAGARLGPALGAFIAGLALAACLGPVRAGPEESSPAGSGGEPVTVHVVRHGWHSGLVIPRDAVPPEAWPAPASFRAARFLEVGWGDRAFYQSPDAGIRLALGASLASEGSVLHAAGLDRPPAERFPRATITPVVLSARGAGALVRFVSGAYALDAAGRPIDLGPGLYPGSRFYAAAGRYSLLYTCNTWIAEALQAGGCPITPAWAFTAGALAFQARRCVPPADRDP